MIQMPKVFQNLRAQQHEARRAELYRDLIRHEAKIGGQLFGDIPQGGRREFFRLDNKSFIWHEEWLNKNGQRQIRTTRYDIRPDVILKAQDGQPYQVVSLQEADRLVEAAELYQQRVREELYSFI